MQPIEKVSQEATLLLLQAITYKPEARGLGCLLFVAEGDKEDAFDLRTYFLCYEHHFESFNWAVKLVNLSVKLVNLSAKLVSDVLQ